MLKARQIDPVDYLASLGHERQKASLSSQLEHKTLSLNVTIILRIYPDKTPLKAEFS